MHVMMGGTAQKIDQRIRPSQPNVRMSQVITQDIESECENAYSHHCRRSRHCPTHNSIWTRSTANSTNGPDRRWSLQRWLNDFTPVLHRPSEPAPRLGKHTSIVRLRATGPDPTTPEDLEAHATTELEDPWLGRARSGAPVHWLQCLGHADEAKRNGSVRAKQKLGSTQRHLRFPAWKGIRPPFRRVFLFLPARRPVGRRFSDRG